jgi:hypothetical protein
LGLDFRTDLFAEYVGSPLEIGSALLYTLLEFVASSP